MPIYSYLCESCEQPHNALQKMSDAALTDCPNCGEATLQKMLSAPGFRLSGSGWYESDFKTSDKKKNLVNQKAESAAPAAPSCSTGGCNACN